MRLKRNIPYILVVLMALIYIFALVGAGFSNPTGLMDSVAAMTGHAKVHLSSGSYSADTVNLAAVITAEDIALLDGFTSLSTANFDGSTCYTEISQWQSSHPGINVYYTVTLPDGTKLTNSETSVNLSGLSHDSVQSTAAALSCISGIRSIELGRITADAGSMTTDDIDYISALFPNVKVSYSFEILGKSYTAADTYVDLTGLTTAQVPAVTAIMAMIPNITDVKIADNATTDGSLAWADLSAIAAACPNAAIDYNFSVCGIKATTSDTSLDLSAITHADVDSVLAVLPGMNQLSYIDIGSSQNDLTYDDLDRLYAACPNAVFSYTTNVWGVDINFKDEILDFNHISMNDQGAAVEKILPYMRSCTTLDMDLCDVDNDHMAAIREKYPNINVIWRIWFGSSNNGYCVRTDAEVILASKPSAYGMLNDSNTANLKYCNKCKSLDLGHNSDLTSVPFIAYMTELENCILTCTSVNSLEPFRNCPNLDYLEIGDAKVTDISPLADCTKLRYLNIGLNKGITDMSCLFGNTGFLKLYLGGTGISQDQVNEMQSILDAAGNTACDLSSNLTYISTSENTGYYTATEGMWRYDNLVGTSENWIHAQQTGVAEMVASEKYLEIREIFRYSEAPNCYSTAANDPLYKEHDSIYY